MDQTVSKMQSFLNSKDEIGIDEAGRGPFIGRVYAGAVWWTHPDDDVPRFIMDSKKLSPKKRKIAQEWILRHLPAWGVGFAEAAEIDELNILQATRLAMSRALDDLRTRYPEARSIHQLIIDGVRWENQFGEDWKVSSVVGGDGKYLSIAAASILAKEAHDSHIRQLCEAHPEWHERYDLLNNMGYGTPNHIKGIETFGVCEQHRKSFKRCA